MAAIVSTADEIYRELGEPSDISIPAIVFWITSNIGRLNNLIDSDYSVESEEIVPAIGVNEKAILKTLYEIYYNKRQINRNLGAAAYTSIAEVKEGNRTVRRANKNEVAKSYISVAKDLQDTLEQQVLAYKMNACEVEQILVPRPVLTDLPGFELSSNATDYTT